MPAHIFFTIFFFLLGGCIGSFLNVVVWRLPRGESLVSPPSHCPNCNHLLAWYDNIPILGWIMLAGRCRYCKQPISPRYPIIEALTATLFAVFYAAYFIWQMRACTSGQAMIYSYWYLPRDWPTFALDLFLISGLLAASLIDAELYIIPPQIPWLITAIAIIVHTIFDLPQMPGAVNLIGSSGLPSPGAGLAAGAAAGLILSFILWRLHIIPTSFPRGEPLLDVDREALAQEIAQARRQGKEHELPPLPPPYTPAGIRAEMRKEMLFLLPPLALGAAWLALTLFVPSIAQWWQGLMAYDWLTGLLGALLGAMVGAFIVWFTRIIGTLVAGRVAMGLGDVHLMLAIGAVLGWGPAVLTFFIAPFFGILVAVYKLIFRRGREMPLGPYLSLAAAFIMLFYCPIADYLRPGLQGLLQLLVSKSPGQ